jgi:FkbM family methyltransferase
VLPPRGTGTVVDIGANIGLISIGLLLEGEFRDAIGVEPDPVNFGLLKRNIAQNGLTERYRSVQAAATAEKSEVRLGLSPDNFGDHRISAAANRVSIPVAGTPIDEIVAAADVSFVCIDTQGYEAAVLAGGQALFGTGVPTLAEVWPYGLEQSERGVAEFCALAAGYWGSFWVWRRSERYVQYPIAFLPKFCEELGTAEGQYDDVLFTRD